jgi:hypothetical protein
MLLAMMVVAMRRRAELAAPQMRPVPAATIELARRMKAMDLDDFRGSARRAGVAGGSKGGGLSGGCDEAEAKGAGESEK